MNVSSPKRLPCLNSSSVLANRLFMSLQCFILSKGRQISFGQEIITTRKRSCGKVYVWGVSVHLKVIQWVSVHGGSLSGGSLSMGISVSGGRSSVQGGSLSRGLDLCLEEGRSLSMGVSVYEDLCLGGSLSSGVGLLGSPPVW